jgi:hypothetical protein
MKKAMARWSVNCTLLVLSIKEYRSFMLIITCGVYNSQGQGRHGRYILGSDP